MNILHIHKLELLEPEVISLRLQEIARHTVVAYGHEVSQDSVILEPANVGPGRVLISLRIVEGVGCGAAVGCKTWSEHVCKFSVIFLF